MSTFTNSEGLKTFKNIVLKEENTGNKHFLLFTTFFLPTYKPVSIFGSHFLVICKLFNYDKSEMLLCSKELDAENMSWEN